MSTSTASYGTNFASDVVIAQKRLSLRKYFSAALFCATVISYVVGFCHMTKYFELHPLYSMIVLLATIHVPMTVYLFYDPAIRMQVCKYPVRFIGVPLLIMATCLTVFLCNTQNRLNQEAVFLTYFMLGVLCWNLWHFGKQNIGVYAYYRLSEAIGKMMPMEKRLIYAGAILGSVSAIGFLGLSSYQSEYSQHANYSNWLAITGYISLVGKYFQYALALFTVGYISFYRARFNWKAALMFFLCVNYFLPAYLSLDWKRWEALFAASSLTHGLQYIVFLWFHSLNTPFPYANKVQKLGRVSKYIQATIFLLTMMVIADIYVFHWVTSHIHLIKKMPDAYWTSLVEGAATGILLNHFWYDSFFWRFSDKDARNWMLLRYNFLFKPAPVIV